MNDIEKEFSLISDKLLNYYLSLDAKQKDLFYPLFNFNEQTGKYILEQINLIEFDKILIFKHLYKNTCDLVFDTTIKHNCSNPNCKYLNKKIECYNVLKKCPECKSELSIVNEENLNNTIQFYLSFFEFYILQEEKESLYLIKYKNVDKFDIKKGASNFKESIYYLLKGNAINLSYLAFKYGNKTEINLLFDYIQNNNLIKNIDNLGFKPVLEQFIHNNNRTYFNTYNGNKYLNMVLTEEEKTQFKDADLKELCPNIYLLLNNLVSNDEKGLDYVLKYLSFVLNNPHRRTEKVLSFYGEEATGKGLYYHFILNVLFEGYCNFVSMSDIENDNFNDFYENSLFIFIDESYYSKSIESLLLNYVTTKSILINKKYGSNRMTDVFFNINTASNKEVPMKVGNRRSVYFRSKTLGGNKIKAVDIGSKLAVEIPKEINNFAKYLKALEVDFKDIDAGCDNMDKQSVNDSTMSLEERFIEEMLSYETLEDFIGSTLLINDTTSRISYRDKYIKDNFIEYEMFLDLYNKFVSSQGLSFKQTIHKFNWFCNKLNINKEDATEFKRMLNSNKKKVYWINKDIITKLYEVLDNE